MVALTALLADMLGDHIDIATLLKLTPILAPVLLDFTDADPHLSQENRLKVQEAIVMIRENKL